jgi:hypothetical protein
MLSSRLIKNTIILFVIVIAFAQISFAQEVKDSKQITDIVSTLKQKILLNSDQETKIIGILTELKANVSAKPENKSSLIKDAQSKLESLLDKRQKMKYDILKNDFWQQIAG